CVKLPGGISPRDCPEVWAATEIAPHSFVYEFSTSISLLEYMAMGRACVVTDMGAVREVVGDAALVVEPENARALAEGINKLIEDKKRREELGRKARKRVEENYSIGKAVEKLEGVYRELLA
ncbi:MAG: glycosyltransferase family 4 protein, partial [Candidatus Diapherotrites archaeon]|nr:glycosyltransferase family 4 protein [Candidatus Diapherotrites archaeon]